MKLTQDTIAQINLFEKITRAKLKDVWEEDEKLVFLVQEGFVKKALGKDNSNLKRLEGMFKRKIRIISFSDNPVKFINNLLYPIRAEHIEVQDDKIVITAKDSQTKGKIFGRSRSNLERLSQIMKRYHKIQEVQVK